jgi:O-antigen ligase
MQACGHYPISETRWSDQPFAAPRRMPHALGLAVPLLFFGVTLWIAQHDFQYASPSFADDEAVDLTPTPARQVSFVALGMFGVVSLLRPSRVGLAPSRGRLACLISLALLIVLSAFWSDTPDISLKRSLIPVLTLVAALGAVKHWRPCQVCSFVVMLAAAFLLVGIGAEIASGSFLRADGRFAGTLHPNSQAVNCAALSLASLALYRDPRWRAEGFWRLAWLALFGAGTLFLLLTKSRTGTAAYLVGLLVLLTIGMPRSKKMLVYAGLAVLSASAILGAFAFNAGEGIEQFFARAVIMGRQQDMEGVSSLTGRLPIWEAILHDVAERPLVGYGYGGFWTPYRVVSYSYIHDWEFTHAHSAYLETLLHVGLVGLVIGLALVVPTIWSAERAYQSTGDSGFRFAAAVLAMALVHGLLDANFVSVGLEPVLALFCIAVVALHGGLFHEKGPNPPPQNRAGELREIHA